MLLTLARSHATNHESWESITNANKNSISKGNWKKFGSVFTALNSISLTGIYGAQQSSRRETRL